MYYISILLPKQDYNLDTCGVILPDDLPLSTNSITFKVHNPHADNPRLPRPYVRLAGHNLPCSPGFTQLTVSVAPQCSEGE